MPDSLDTSRGKLNRRLILICCAFSVLTGATAWIGMASGNTIIASLGENLIPMAPSTSLLFISFGITGFLAIYTASSPLAGRAARIITTISAAIALPLLILSLQGIYLDMESFGLSGLKRSDLKPVGHMSPITAFSFLIIAASFFVFLTPRLRTRKHITGAFWLSVLLLSFYAMLSLAYLMGNPLFYSNQLIPPAASTCLAFLALGFALLLQILPTLWPDSPGTKRDQRNSTNMIVIFIFLASGIIATGYFYHRSYQKNYLKAAERQLSAIADLKTNELQNWRNERLLDAHFIYKNRLFATTVNNYFKNPSDSAKLQDLHSWLDTLTSNSNYNAIFLLDARGRQRLSFPSDAFPLSSTASRAAIDSLTSGQITFTDFYPHEINHKIYLNIQIPIFTADSDNVPLGIILFRIDPESFLYPYIQRWPADSTSAETLLVRRDGDNALYLNELRFDSSNALNRRIPLTSTNTPAVMAILGQTGIVEGIDYRGVPVMAALRHIDNSPWFLVARIDLQEINNPLQQRLWIMVAMVVALLASAAATIGLVLKQQTVGTILQNKERLQCIVNVFQFNAPTTQELLDFALNEALRMTGSRYGYIYYYDEDTGLFTLNSWSRDVMDSCKVVDPQTTYELEKTGIWGEAVRQRKPIMVNDFSAPDPLKKGIPEGHVTLTNFLTIPLFDKGRIVAVVGVSNKQTAYDDSDLLQLTLLMDAVWKVAGRKHYEEELKHKNFELERFMYTVSHDLKSPLVTISTFLTYLQQDMDKDDKPRIQQDMAYMRSAADKMEILLAELLELFRVGTQVNKSEPISLKDIYDETLQLVAGHISQRNATVICHDSSLTLFGDRIRLVEIWQNLVENAIKYMGDQPYPKIELSSEFIDRQMVFFVRDNGMGIETNYHENIFGLFNKLDASSEGSGLGLALVKRIVETYKGQIWVESEGVGHGSCFRFTLPGALKNSV